MPRRRTRVVKLPPAESLGNLFVCRDQLDTEAYILGFVDGAGIDCYFIKAQRTHERRAFTGLEISTSPNLSLMIHSDVREILRAAASSFV